MKCELFFFCSKDATVETRSVLTKAFGEHRVSVCAEHAVRLAIANCAEPVRFLNESAEREYEITHARAVLQMVGEMRRSL